MSKRLGISGFPSGDTVNVGVTQGAQSVSEDATWPAPESLTAQNLQFLASEPSNNLWRGTASTIEDKGAIVGLNWGSGCAPKMRMEHRVVTRADANVVYSNFEGFSTWRHTEWVGGSVDVYRAQNEVLNLIRTSTVIGGAWDTWVLATPTNQVITAGSSWEFKFDNFNRPGVTYWFSVASVDASGNIGPKSAAVSYSAPATLPTGVPSNSATTALTLTAVAGSTAAPTGLAAVTKSGDNGVAQLTWTSAETRFVVFVSYVDPSLHYGANGPYLTLENDGGPALKVGDWVVFKNKLTTLSPDYITSRVWTAAEGRVHYNPPITQANRLNSLAGVAYSFVEFSGGDPKPDPSVGTYFMRVELDEGVALPEDGRFWEGGTGQEFYEVLRTDTTYFMEFWYRADKSFSQTLDFNVAGVSDSTISHTTSWQRFYREFSPSSVASGTQARNWLFTATGPTGGVVIDRTSIKLGIVGRGAHSMRASIAAQLSPGQFMRNHQFVKRVNDGFDINTFTDPPGTGSMSTGYTLDSYLTSCLDHDQQPLLQFDPFLLEEGADLVAYLAAPVSSGHPFAAKRAAQGNPTPWIEQFSAPPGGGPRMIVEFSNETWNTTEGFFSVPSGIIDEVTAEVYTTGEAAALIANRMIANMQASLHWSLLEPYIEFGAGGWGRETGVSQFTEDFCRMAPGIKYWGIAAYTFGWETGSFTPSRTGADILTIMNYDQVVNKERRNVHISRLQAACAATGRTYGVDVVPFCYEGGPSFDLPSPGITATNVSVDCVMKCRASGGASLYSMLAQALAGFEISNFFVLGEGFFWSSRSTWQEGGGEFPVWTALQIINDEMAPCKVYPVSRLRGETGSINNPSSVPVSVDRVNVVALQSILSPSTWMIVAINTDLDPSQLDVGDPLYSATPGGDQTITVGTSWQSASGLSLWESRGGMFEHNRFTPGFRLDTGPDTYTLADADCVEIAFPATTPSLPANLQRIPITLGAGEFVMMKFTGVVAP